jgi:drug/metabolite transporter (DMT)-like permease
LSPVALANLLIVYVLWGSTYLAIRFAVAAWPPFLLGFVRFVVAGALLLAVTVARGESVRLDRKSLITSVVGGLLFFPIGNGAVVWAEQTTSSGLVATLIATVPLWMAAIGWWLGTGQRPSLRMFASLGLGLVGVAVLVARGRTVVSPLNAAVLMAGAFAWAFTSVWTAKRRPP